MIQILAAAVAVIADQWMKHWVVVNMDPPGTIRRLIPGVIHLEYTLNEGAALGLFSGMRWVLFGISAAFVIAAVWILLKKKIKHPFGVWSFTALLVGAAGNAIDRLLHGYVVDMFRFDILLDFFVFNIADVFITFGGICFVIYFLIDTRRSETQKKLPQTQETGEVNGPEEADEDSTD